MLHGPSHSGVELHGFLSYLVKVALSTNMYTVYGYKGKQVRDNIHSFEESERCAVYSSWKRKSPMRKQAEVGDWQDGSNVSIHGQAWGRIAMEHDTQICSWWHTSFFSTKGCCTALRHRWRGPVVLGWVMAKTRYQARFGGWA